jgi:UDP-N-acetylglucosamine 4-epimerase
MSLILNMLMAAKEANVKRFIYAASSSTYGDSVGLQKWKMLSKTTFSLCYTKYVNELYADIF